MPIIPAILAALSAIETLSELIPKLAAAARQSGELTADQEREFRDRYNAARGTDAFKTDDQLAAERTAGVPMTAAGANDNRGA